MDCPDARRLLDAHLDEELDVVHDAAVAAHLDTCPACAEAALARAEQRQMRREKITRHRAPAELAPQIRAALPRTTAARPAAWWPQALALAASVALAALVGNWWGARTARADSLLEEMTAVHARARLTGHVTDVESSDRHTVKPWFAGRVDFAPVVPNLAEQGFPLTGGRLERLGGRTVAALVYARRKHSIDLLVWTGDPAPVRGTTSHAGYSIIGWQEGGLNCTAVSDVAPEDLAAFVNLIRAAK